MTPARPSKRRIVSVVFPQMVLLDLAGPYEVFSAANRCYRSLHAGHPEPYILETVSATRGLRLDTATHLTLLADRQLDDCGGPIDTLLVPGGMDISGVARNDSLLRFLRTIAGQVRRVGSICTGAFVLAAAGLLAGRRATTHWEQTGRLAKEYPNVSVEPNKLYVQDGNVYTSAGVTAGIDLALTFVEEDLGPIIASQVARTLVVFSRRPAGASQQSLIVEPHITEHRPFRDLLVWAAEHPDADLSVEALSARAHMSVRNFSRAFRKQVGQTPARFVEQLRVDAARLLLEASDARLDRIASQSGFGSANSMRRSFLRVLGVSPSDYRERAARQAAPDRDHRIA